MLYVRNLNDLNRNDADIAGGKGASLGELIIAGFDVPPGFVVLTSAFDQFIDDNRLRKNIDETLKSIDINDIAQIDAAAKNIQNTILAASVNSEMVEQIRLSFAKLQSTTVAVRSSATAEDSTHDSWAGQLDTLLNISEPDLVNAIKKCWASLFTPRAIYYRLNRFSSGANISVAIVIQKMINGRCSGVAFSSHPESNDADQVVIESTSGLGEAVVGGEISPDRYAIEKETWLVLDHPKTMSSLTERNSIELAKNITAIERHYGYPVDVEWSADESKFYFIQCRPITTLNESSQAINSVLDYVQSNRWIIGVRADSSLLFFSAKAAGYEKFIDQSWGNQFAETMLVPVTGNRMIRLINLNQAKRFHAISRRIIETDPAVLIKHINDDERLYSEIDLIGLDLLQAIDRKDGVSGIHLYAKLIDYYEQVHANFITIFSLGRELTDLNRHDEISKLALNRHDTWRNSVALKEELLGERLYLFFKFIIESRGLKIDPKSVLAWLTVWEMDDWLNERLTDSDICDLIDDRHSQACIFTKLNFFENTIISKPEIVAAIVGHIESLMGEDSADKCSNELKGWVAYNPKKIISGKVIVIRDKNDLADKGQLAVGHILVATQTTPHYIPYLRDVIAIITDEGGITCHAAIVAREMKIPCIVGTKFATEILNDGDIVEILPNEGLIRKISST
ncbi:MAG: PEP/pyruvate-binding domain-containing protein [Patescibacteria group bacterium]